MKILHLITMSFVLMFDACVMCWEDYTDYRFYNDTSDTLRIEFSQIDREYNFFDEAGKGDHLLSKNNYVNTLFDTTIYISPHKMITILDEGNGELDEELEPRHLSRYITAIVAGSDSLPKELWGKDRWSRGKHHGNIVYTLHIRRDDL